MKIRVYKFIQEAIESLDVSDFFIDTNIFNIDSSRAMTAHLTSFCTAWKNVIITRKSRTGNLRIRNSRSRNLRTRNSRTGNLRTRNSEL